MRATIEALEKAEAELQSLREEYECARVGGIELRAENARVTKERDDAIAAFKDASRLRSEIQQARIKAEDERDAQCRATIDIELKRAP